MLQSEETLKVNPTVHGRLDKKLSLSSVLCTEKRLFCALSQSLSLDICNKDLQLTESLLALRQENNFFLGENSIVRNMEEIRA